MISHLTPEGESKRMNGHRKYWEDVRAGRRIRKGCKVYGNGVGTLLNGNMHLDPSLKIVVQAPTPEPPAFVPRPSEFQLLNYIKALWALAADEGVDPKRVLPMVQHAQPE